MIMWCRRCDTPMDFEFRGPLHMPMTARITCGQCSLIEYLTKTAEETACPCVMVDGFDYDWRCNNCGLEHKKR